MKSSSRYFVLALLCLGLWGTVQARDLVVPAGTLMTCTLDEPKFSSSTVAVGDPFLCYPRTIQQFGQTVFPRGTYFVGHLEADKDPGHFVGKGYLKLAFDRIGLPATDVPLNAKVIAVGGYNVDREGKIIGHGHATRDVVEWMLPPLWPWKILTLPARGPRPTLKGEVRVTLRIMDDFVVPQTTTPGWHRFGEPMGLSTPPAVRQPGAVPVMSRQPLVTEAALVRPELNGNATLVRGEGNLGGAPAMSVSLEADSEPAPLTIAPAVRQPQPQRQLQPVTTLATTVNAWPANVTLFALTDGTIFPATQYYRDRDRLTYLVDGDQGMVALRDIDWGATTRLNSARNVRVTLRNPPVDDAGAAAGTN